MKEEEEKKKSNLISQNKSNFIIHNTTIDLGKSQQIKQKYKSVLFCPTTSSKEEENFVKFLSKKTLRFKTQKEEEHMKRKNEEDINANEGRWSDEEHEKFLEGLEQYGINWKRVKSLIDSRTSVQVRSHAQKFFQKLKICKDKELGIDFTSKNICNIKDMINQIKLKNINYNVKNMLKYLSKKNDNIKKITKNNENENSKVSPEEKNNNFDSAFKFQKILNENNLINNSMILIYIFYK